MSYYVVNHDNKTITEFKSEKEAKNICSIALRFSNSLCVFYYSAIQLKKLETTLKDFKRRKN